MNRFHQFPPARHRRGWSASGDHWQVRRLSGRECAWRCCYACHLRLGQWPKTGPGCPGGDDRRKDPPSAAPPSVRVNPKHGTVVMPISCERSFSRVPANANRPARNTVDAFEGRRWRVSANPNGKRKDSHRCHPRSPARHEARARLTLQLRCRKPAAHPNKGLHSAGSIEPTGSGGGAAS